MAAHSESIADALVALIAVAGTHVDLTGRVTLGHAEAAPPSAPWVTLAIASASLASASPNAPLGKYRASLKVEVEGWAQGITASPDGRIRGALRLLSDLCAALGAARGLPAVSAVSVIDVVPDMSALDGDAHGIAPGYGLVVGTITIDFLTTGRV